MCEIPARSDATLVRYFLIHSLYNMSAEDRKLHFDTLQLHAGQVSSTHSIAELGIALYSCKIAGTGRFDKRSRCTHLFIEFICI